ncbi:hypothetical protein Isop_1093 [Isosphaera pallida ATCC 43644]|uniref:Uncharacterized protein n=1 Tax=Isosphaera pallida (strain ATCC 43644 / DSM 9630 / IS1B) TaxID=575540 RepID=E8R4T5_ISOPI|nr:hypothetical protein Isop_1093 [Isosphaera pallida ATCC 43644]
MGRGVRYLIVNFDWELVFLNDPTKPVKPKMRETFHRIPEHLGKLQIKSSTVELFRTESVSN